MSGAGRHCSSENQNSAINLAGNGNAPVVMPPDYVDQHSPDTEMRLNLPVPTIETGIFSELFGFVVTDPASLEHFHQKTVTGVNLLDLYTQTDEGNRVAEAGAAIPIIGINAGYYSVIFRGNTTPTTLPGEPLARSGGWVLNVTSGSIVLCGIGYLSSWNPMHKSARHIALPIGWYAVEIWLGSSTNNDDFALEIVLFPSENKPLFSADVTRKLLEEKNC